jgi:hypothetical protein
MVYVDNMNMPFGRMIMCHMIADTTEELLDMADKIVVQRKWIQYAGTNKEHFDICLEKKKLAIDFGAIEISWRDLGLIVLNRQINDNSSVQQRGEQGVAPRP